MKFLYERVFDVKKRGEFINPREFRKILPWNSDLYRSYYGYDHNILDHLVETKSEGFANGRIAGFPGPFSLSEALIDIDGHNDNSLDQALNKTSEYVMTLLYGYDVPEENIMVWFSGGGFHLCLPSGLFGEKFQPSKNLPRIVRNTLLKMFPDADNIYDQTRIIRLGHSYNSKRGYWKVPLPLRWVINKDIDAILEKARSPSAHEDEYTHDVAEPVLSDFVVDVIENLETNTHIELPDTDLTNVVTCMHKLYKRGPVKGRRHTDLLRLVSHWRRQHLPFEVCVGAAQKWLEPLSEDFPDDEVVKIVRDVFKNDYRYGCQDSVRLEFCDSKCIFYPQKNEGSEVADPQTMHNEFIELAMSSDHQQVFDIATVYDIENSFKIYPTEFVTIMGDTGVNKTAFAQELMIAARPRTGLYISTEMGKGLLYRRFAQMVSDMDKEEIMSYYRKGHIPPGIENMDHIRMVETAPSVQGIYKYLLDIKPDICVVDVIEDIGDDPDSNRRIDTAALGLNQLSKRLGIIVIVVSHIKKQMGGTLDLNSSKGPKSLMQKSDKVIALEGEADNPSGYRQIRSLKARDESPFNFDANFNPKNFRLNGKH